MYSKVLEMTDTRPYRHKMCDSGIIYQTKILNLPMKIFLFLGQETSEKCLVS